MSVYQSCFCAVGPNSSLAVDAEKFAAEFLAAVDTDGDGMLSLCELAWCIKTDGFGNKQFLDAGNWLKLAPGKWKKYDTRGDGNIDAQNLKVAMTEFLSMGWQYKIGEGYSGISR